MCLSGANERLNVVVIVQSVCKFACLDGQQSVCKCACQERWSDGAMERSGHQLVSVSVPVRSDGAMERWNVVVTS